MENSEDAYIFRYMLRWFFIVVLGLMILTALGAFVGSVFDISFLPWKIQMQTSIIRNSNGYITSQQAALRQFYTGYQDAPTQSQQNAAIRQMHEIADTIPNYVQPDIAQFLASH